MVFIRRSAGTITGVARVDQGWLPVELLDENDPEVVAFLNPPPIDLSNTDNLEKTLKAMALCIAQVGGLTVPQIKALFKNKYDSLP